LAALAGLASLDELSLGGTDISDAGLKQLQRCRKLTSVYLEMTQVTESGVAALRKALPGITAIAPSAR
jgi:hypothetical protein